MKQKSLQKQLLSYQSAEEFQNSKSFNPDVVVIMLGTNDSGQTIIATTIYKALTGNSSAAN